MVETEYPVDPKWGYITARNIRQIQAIVDCVECNTSLIQLRSIEDKSLIIGSGFLGPIILVSDPVSQTNLKGGGYSACSSEYSLEIEYDTPNCLRP